MSKDLLTMKINHVFLIGTYWACQCLFVFSHFNFGVTLLKDIWNCWMKSTWNFSSVFRNKKGIFFCHYHSNSFGLEFPSLCIHYSKQLFWICQHINMLIVLKEDRIFPPPQRLILFWFAINVKQISLQQSNTIIESHLTMTNDEISYSQHYNSFFLMII